MYGYCCFEVRLSALEKSLSELLTWMPVIQQSLVRLFAVEILRGKLGGQYRNFWFAGSYH
jgi:hypothetical protein